MTKRIIVMISGSGSNLQAIIDAKLTGMQLVLVVSNRQSAYGLTRAELADIPTLYFPIKHYKDMGQSREAYDQDLARQLSAYKPDLIVLAGWMHVLSSDFLDNVGASVINLHPALPGKFAGTHAIERAFEAYKRQEIEYTGCMVHYVIPEVDAGPVIVEQIVPINDDDTLDMLEKRMHEAEHQIIVKAIRQILKETS